MSTKLDEFWAAHDWAKLERLNEWTVVRDAERVTLELSAKDKERYRVLCTCTNYPQEAPSVVFVNDEGSRLDPKGWPAGNPQFFEIVKPPQNCFLCTELTREGLTHHPDWKSTGNAWDGSKHTLIDIFNLIHRLLHSKDYSGRGGTK